MPSSMLHRFVPVLLTLLVLLPIPGAWAAEGEDANAVPRILGVDPNKVVNLTKEQKKYAEDLGQEVVCLCGTCPRHTITNCDCGWAHTHKRTLQVALLEGKTRDDILEAYMEAYGAKAFPTPPGSLGQLTWLLPYVVIVLAFGIFLVVGLRMLRRQRSMQAVEATADPSAPAAPAGDQTDRAILDRELEDLD